MSERYKVIYKLPPFTYTPGVPVLIVGGNLLRDSLNGQNVVQLKLFSVYHRSISDITVQINVMDSQGNLVETKMHSYEGLELFRDRTVGDTVVIPLNDTRGSRMDVLVTRVTATGGEVITADASVSAELKAQKPLSSILGPDPEMEKQYKLTYGPSVGAADERDGFWHCSCGAVNLSGESICHLCGCNKEAVLHPDIAQLKRDRDIRVAKEAAEREARKEKERKYGIIGGAVIAAAIIILVLVTKIFIPESNYRKAKAYMEDGAWQEAYTLLWENSSYKDCHALAEEASANYWIDQYKGILSGDYYSDLQEEYDTSLINSSAAEFALAYIDNDYIPELAIKIYDQVYIYTIRAEASYIEGPYRSMTLWAADNAESGYFAGGDYCRLSYYEDGKETYSQWLPYPEGSSSYSFTKETWYGGDISYTVYDPGTEENLDVSEDEFRDYIESSIGESEYKAFAFNANSQGSRDKLIVKHKGV